MLSGKQYMPPLNRLDHFGLRPRDPSGAWLGPRPQARRDDRAAPATEVPFRGLGQTDVAAAAQLKLRARHVVLLNLFDHPALGLASRLWGNTQHLQPGVD